jgi:HK97 family phage major capsid protein
VVAGAPDHGDLNSDLSGPRQARDEALRTVERYSQSGELRSDAADRLDRVIRTRDPLGYGSRYLAAVGSEHYLSAFWKLVKDPTTGHLRFTPQEVQAVQEATAADELRTMSVGVGSAGGFGVPFQLDPSIVLSSAGATSPVRQLARVEDIVTDQWKGVSSDGVVAAYAAELTEASDNSPTLAQPVADTAKGQAWVPFSIELGQDYATLQRELGRLLNDARAVVDATQFLTGTGSNAPKGILTGLTTSQRVQTAGAGAFVLADVYSLKQALPARFQDAAAFTWHPNRIDTIYRFVGGNSTEPPLMPSREGPLLGKPNHEWSTMATATTTGTKIGIVGDWKHFLIADRIGSTVELVPHVFGSANRFPIGARGLYYYWRTGSEVLAPNAFRYLEVL